MNNNNNFIGAWYYNNGWGGYSYEEGGYELPWFDELDDEDEDDE